MENNRHFVFYLQSHIYACVRLSSCRLEQAVTSYCILLQVGASYLDQCEISQSSMNTSLLHCARRITERCLVSRPPYITSFDMWQSLTRWTGPSHRIPSWQTRICEFKTCSLHYNSISEFVSCGSDDATQMSDTYAIFIFELLELDCLIRKIILKIFV